MVFDPNNTYLAITELAIICNAHQIVIAYEPFACGIIRIFAQTGPSSVTSTALIHPDFEQKNKECNKVMEVRLGYNVAMILHS
jgi:2-hydroxychromene-2-carboxylate isomerase